MKAIVVKDLNKIYRKDKPRALDDFCLEIEKGDLFGLIGVNGAGKSTLLYIIAGLVKRDSGEISIMGDTIEDDSYLYRRRMGFILDKPFYLEKLTAQEYLQFVAGMYSLPEEEATDKIGELLDFFELSDTGDTLIEAFSKGMKQKVSLAAAIIHEPELLILDEPFDGIDIPSTEAIKRILSRMNSRGTTLLITSHNLEIVESLCSKCAIIDKGRIAFQSSMDGLEETLGRLGTEGRLKPSLREIFLQITSADSQHKTLSWLS